MNDNDFGCAIITGVGISVAVFLVAIGGINFGNRLAQEEAILINHAEIIDGEFKWKEPCK